jgi:hypothetical protein
MKFIIMQFSQRSVFLPVRSKYLQHCSQKPSVCFPLKVKDQVSHPYSTTGKISSVYFNL